jgi:hypothetical protein
MANGASLVATIEKSSETIGWLSRDPAAALIGPGWGVGSVHPVVSAPLSAPPVLAPVDPELLERKVQPGDRIRILMNDPGRPLRQFGTGFVSRVLKEELEAAGLWKPGMLVGLSYSDRYLKAPLPVALFMRTALGLRDALAPKGATIPLSIVTEPIRDDRYRGACRQLRDNWSDDDARADVVFALADHFRFEVEYDDAQAPHARMLTLDYDDGSRAVVLLDQGFGYWRAQSGEDHNFRAGAATQAKSLVDSPAFVAGNGETYIAITRG